MSHDLLEHRPPAHPRGGAPRARYSPELKAEFAAKYGLCEETCDKEELAETLGIGSLHKAYNLASRMGLTRNYGDWYGELDGEQIEIYDPKKDPARLQLRERPDEVEWTERDDAKEMRKYRPDWSSESFICRRDLARYRTAYVHSLLETERGELTSLEQEVLHSIREHELLAKNVDAEFEEKWTLAEKLADRIATFGGSWAFLLCFGGFLGLWIAVNTVVLVVHPPDPYPFILLNLILSCLAAIQAPVIMMSQNRQEAKDRLRSQHDYQVNLKAELEIRHLHDKLDHLLSHQWDRLAQIQEIQLDLLSEFAKRK